MNDPLDWVTCPCGHRFDYTTLPAGMIRGYGGKYLAKAVERSSLENRYEVQCPNCQLWFDLVDGEVHLR